ncbi:hypothetical protein C7G83_06820 [Siccibacter turicensis]|uniref:Uncharacterized protein n=1 Tax=Siccibacter turicensis TaxID=357233 RepID=A0A2P8VNA8_9ENTR|nr:hypothetical protein C7G83_06820 [Siccibacter turicensis]
MRRALLMCSRLLYAELNVCFFAIRLWTATRHGTETFNRQRVVHCIPEQTIIISGDVSLCLRLLRVTAVHSTPGSKSLHAAAPCVRKSLRV